MKIAAGIIATLAVACGVLWLRVGHEVRAREGYAAAAVRAEQAGAVSAATAAALRDEIARRDAIAAQLAQVHMQLRGFQADAVRAVRDVEETHACLSSPAVRVALERVRQLDDAGRRDRDAGPAASPVWTRAHGAGAKGERRGLS